MSRSIFFERIRKDYEDNDVLTHDNHAHAPKTEVLLALVEIAADEIPPENCFIIKLSVTYTIPCLESLLKSSTLSKTAKLCKSRLLNSARNTERNSKFGWIKNTVVLIGSFPYKGAFHAFTAVTVFEMERSAQS